MVTNSLSRLVAADSGGVGKMLLEQLAYVAAIPAGL